MLIDLVRLQGRSPATASHAALTHLLHKHACELSMMLPMLLAAAHRCAGVPTVHN